ncbi:hypothetical protein EON65_30830 [archaeon]|nr:MAG: hypothetical protein EON65_30830 [archaeon]
MGKELFPQLGQFSEYDDTIGLTIGFVAGFLLINYQDSFIEMVEGWCSCFFANSDGPGKPKDSPKKGSEERKSLLPKGSKDNLKAEYKAINSDDGHSGAESEAETEIEEGEHPILLLGSQVISLPTERSRIRDKVSELVHSIHMMQNKAQILFELKGQTHSVQVEILADQIDEEIHKLQYYVDHCRRYWNIVLICFTHHTINQIPLPLIPNPTQTLARLGFKCGSCCASHLDHRAR